MITISNRQAELELHDLIKGCQGDLTFCIQFVTSLKIMNISLCLTCCFKNKRLWILGDVQAKGFCVPLVPTQWAGKDSEDIWGAVRSWCSPFSPLPFGQLPSHSASSPGSLPSLLISSLSAVCLADGGPCQSHWARALWAPVKAPWWWREDMDASSLEKPSRAATELRRLYCKGLTVAFHKGMKNFYDGHFGVRFVWNHFSSVVWHFVYACVRSVHYVVILFFGGGGVGRRGCTRWHVRS